MAQRERLPLFTSGDIDGFFGLFFSGFPDLLLIVGLAPVCGLSTSFVVSRILPGVAVSVVIGNFFYASQARRLALNTGRTDVTAIPFGVNTPTIFAYVFLIMGPVYTQTHSGTAAWQAGIFASLLSGIIQTAGAFCTDWIRRYTPRAALLCPLAGLSLAYLCLGFIFGVFEQAAIALVPMIILFTLYGSRLRLPGRIPPGLVAIAIGAALVAILRALHIYHPLPAELVAPGLYLTRRQRLCASRQPPALDLPPRHRTPRRARYSWLPADPRIRPHRGRRIPHRPIPSHQWTRHPRGRAPWQPVSDDALHRPRRAQGQRRALRLLRPQWNRHPGALRHRSPASGSPHRTA